jgi:ferredoxin, 2Fe-2S
VSGVRVEPLGADIELEPGEALADAAWRLGYEWPTTCWGQADSMLCRVEVIAGAELVEPAVDDERRAIARHLPRSQRGRAVRLACQLYVIGDGVVVRKDGVGPPSPR